jgi:hypothetical protein
VVGWEKIAGWQKKQPACRQAGMSEMLFAFLRVGKFSRLFLQFQI